MKIVKYNRLDGTDLVIPYDENQPCIHCALPVISASMGGTVLCSWCDCGRHRIGGKITQNLYDKYSLISYDINHGYYEYFKNFDEIAKKYPYITEEFDVNRIKELVKLYEKNLPIKLP